MFARQGEDMAIKTGIFNSENWKRFCNVPVEATIVGKNPFFYSKMDWELSPKHHYGGKRTWGKVGRNSKTKTRCLDECASDSFNQFHIWQQMRLPHFCSTLEYTELEFWAQFLYKLGKEKGIKKEKMKRSQVFSKRIHRTILKAQRKTTEENLPNDQPKNALQIMKN